MSIRDADRSAENRELRRENSALRKSIEKLRAENAELRSERGLRRRGDEIEELLWQIGRRERMMSAQSYFGYISALFKSNSVWLVCKKGISYFRKFRLISVLLRIVTRIVIFAENSVAFIAWLSAAIVVLPFVAIFSVVSILVALIRSRRSNKMFYELSADKNVYVFFASKKQLSGEGFFAANIKELSRGGALCLIVSPYSFGRKGLFSRNFYVTARREAENVYMVRKHYYFMLRRFAIEPASHEMICIY